MAALVLSMAGGEAFSAISSWDPLMERLMADGFEPAYVRSAFTRADLAFNPQIMVRKVNVLLATKLNTEKRGKPAEPKVLDRYLNPILLAGAYASLRENHSVLKRIESAYGVPGPIIIAVYLVETKLGRMTGDQKAFEVLANMALGGDFELIKDHVMPKDLSPEMRGWAAKRARQKGNWAYQELAALLRYSMAIGADPTNIPGSVYGAIGLCQFMPSNALHYGRDGDGNGKVDLFSEEDALFSIGYFLKEHGWKPGLSVKDQRKVIYRYNHSMDYALTILKVAERLQKTDSFFGRG
mgnify:CR=1 FL=1